MNFRSEFPICQSYAYFDCASLGPFPRSSLQLVQDWAREQAEGGSIFWPGWFDKMNACFPLCARLIGARTEEVALTRTTTEGLKLVAEGFRWQPGDNIVFPANEFPANIHPWLYLRRRGVETRAIPTAETGTASGNGTVGGSKGAICGGRLTPESIEPYLDDRTRIVSISWVSFCNGWRADLKAIANLVHSRGALLCVDAIQGLGAFPLDVSETDVDFLSAGAQKWLLSAQGAGLFYCKESLLDRLENINYGWSSIENCTDFSRTDQPELKTARRFWSASTSTPNWLSLYESIQLIERYTPEAIAAQILKVRDYLLNKLEKYDITFISDRTAPAENASGIVVFRLNNLTVEDHAALVRFCISEKVVPCFRGGGIRIAIHGYNDESDIDRLIDVLEAFLSNRFTRP